MFPMSTTQVARLLDLPEHRVANLERLGKLRVPMICGRRHWSADLVLAAARLLGRDTVEIRNICAKAAAQ